MPGNEGRQICHACQFVPVNLPALGPAGFYPSDPVFCNSCMRREDISHFLLQTPAVLHAVLRRGANDKDAVTRQRTGLFSSTLLPFEKKMCLRAVIPVAGGVCGSYQHHFVSRMLRGQFLAGPSRSPGRIAGRRAGRTRCFQQGDGGCRGSLQGSGCQHDASALDRNPCPSSHGVTICTSLQQRPAQGKILSR